MTRRRTKMRGLGRLKMHDQRTTDHQNPGGENAGHEKQDNARCKTTTDSVNDTVQLTNGLSVRRPGKKMSIIKQTRIKACVRVTLRRRIVHAHAVAARRQS